MADERVGRASGSSQTASSKKVAPFIAVAALAIVGLVVWRVFFAQSTPSSVVELTGRVEGDDSAVAAKVAGRILEIRVREGDDMKAGDVIAFEPGPSDRELGGTRVEDLLLVTDDGNERLTGSFPFGLVP